MARSLDGTWTWMVYERIRSRDLLFSLSFLLFLPSSLAFTLSVSLSLSPSLTDSVLEYSPVFLLTFAFSSHERTDSDSLGF